MVTSPLIYWQVSRVEDTKELEVSQRQTISITTHIPASQEEAYDAAVLREGKEPRICGLGR